MAGVNQPASRDLRSELIAAAVSMLAEPQPVTVPSLRSIARACQVAPSAVYWHFPSEADLRSAVLDAEYSDMVASIEQALSQAPPRADPLTVAGEAYIAWGLAHPGAYQLLFESGDSLPAARAAAGPRLQQRIVSLAAAVDPGAPFAAALLLWSAWHGIVSLRLHKTDWDWGQTAQEANARIVSAMVQAASA
ncbi:MAG TPA: TetR/AcrR family transcriptional regulator [Trebonia sp.]|nr:TetR/AcrR family transcriptional regulator [Trebonia sp.]